MPAKPDLSEFVAFSKVRRMKCSIAVAFEQLENECDALKAALVDETITTTGISRWLLTRGVSVKPATVRRHRNGECSCDD